jgi:hypothetical protein
MMICSPPENADDDTTPPARVDPETDVEVCAVLAMQTVTKRPLPTTVSAYGGPDTQEGGRPPRPCLASISGRDIQDSWAGS